VARYAKFTGLRAADLPWIIASGVDRGYRVPWLMDYTAPWTRNLQTSAGLEVTFSTHLSLGGLSAVKTFTTEIDFATAEEAFLFAEEIPLKIADIGTLETGIIGGAGGVIIYPNAVLAGFEAKPSGDASLSVVYSFAVGQPSAVPTP